MAYQGTGVPLQCPSEVKGLVHEGRYLTVHCRSKFCGGRQRRVIHTFDLWDYVDLAKLAATQGYHLIRRDDAGNEGAEP